MKKLTAYQYTRMWFDFAFENPDLINSNHTAVYLWQVELCNRMGWSDKFASPASQAMAATGIKSYNTYIKTFNELCKFGAIKLIKKSINQYQSCIIALSDFNKASDKALDKALATQSESTMQSSSSIIKPQTSNSINTITKQQTLANTIFESQDVFGEKVKSMWLDLCSTDKWKNKKERALKMSLKKLQSFEEDYAIELMENAIANEYQGVVFPNSYTDYEKWKKAKSNIVPATPNNWERVYSKTKVVI